jgi:hypothetical protein
LGDDAVYGLGGADGLAGNEGNDRLDGGEDGDIYAFGIGDGMDRIVDTGTLGSDVIAFGPGITPDMLSLSLGSLLIKVGDKGDAIHLEGFDPDDARGSGVIEYFRFMNGVTLDYQQLLDQGFDLLGTEGDDTLSGTSVTDRFDGGRGNDTYLFGRASGQDFIEDLDTNGLDVDTVRFGADVNVGDIKATRNGNYISVAVNGTSDELAIRWQRLDGYGIERFEFADGTAWDASNLEDLAMREGGSTPAETDPAVDSPTQENGFPSHEEQDHHEHAHDDHYGDQYGGRHWAHRGDTHHWLGDGHPGHEGDRMAKYFAAWVARAHHYDFEVLEQELEHSQGYNAVLTSREIARRWQLVGRLNGAVTIEDDEAARGAAMRVFVSDAHFGAGAFGGTNLSGFEEAPGNTAKHRVFQGLQEGFIMLRI